MFSGIIEALGRIEKINKKKDGLELEIHSSLPLATVRVGDSIAIDGCCLTVSTKSKFTFTMFLSHETLNKTNLRTLKKGDQVNLERSMPVSGRLDGHIVQGHVETVGAIFSKKTVGESLVLGIKLAKDYAPFIVSKGSIAIDGISLTINLIEEKKKSSKDIALWFNLIPHTLLHTTLALKPIGAKVNVETDILGRYVYQMLKAYRKPMPKQSRRRRCRNARGDR